MFNKLMVLGAFLSFTLVSAYAEQISLPTPFDAMQKVNMLEQAVNKYKLAPMSNLQDSMVSYESSTKELRKTLQIFVKILKKQIVKNNNTGEIIFEGALLEKVLIKAKTNYDKKQRYMRTFWTTFGVTAVVMGIPLGLFCKYENYPHYTSSTFKAVVFGTGAGSLLAAVTGGLILLIKYGSAQHYLKDLMFIFRELYAETLTVPYIKAV